MKPHHRFLWVRVFMFWNCLVIIGWNTSQASASDPLPVAEVVRQIDDLFLEYWQQQQVEPTVLADDGEWLRRLSLDLIGKIPSGGETQQFIANSDPDKYDKLPGQLLRSAPVANHWAHWWRLQLLPSNNANVQNAGLIQPFEDWLRLQFAQRRRFDRIAYAILTAKVSGRDTMQAMNARFVAAPSPAGFLLVNEQKPENLATQTARAFLGVQLDCAQCHDHFFSHWKQEQFWQFAAYFQDGAADAHNPPELTIPESEQIVRGKFLPPFPNGDPNADPNTAGLVAQQPAEPDADRILPHRVRLARWLIDPTNPYFARAIVNRVWAQLTGQGLVEPMDGFDPKNPPKHPKVLQLLADQFQAHEYNIFFVAEVVARTRLYRLSSRCRNSDQANPNHFARMPVRRMTAPQLLDSLLQATGIQLTDASAIRMNLTQNRRDAFLQRFTVMPLANADYQASMLEALTMMNGTLTQAATRRETCPTLASLLDALFLTTEQRLEMLFLTTVQRRPTTAELKKIEMYRLDMQTTHASQSASAVEQMLLEDVFWALLNSGEFVAIP